MHTDETMHEHVYMICHQAHSDKVTILKSEQSLFAWVCARGNHDDQFDLQQ